jgi:hypothetical protein
VADIDHDHHAALVFHGVHDAVVPYSDPVETLCALKASSSLEEAVAEPV